MLREIKIKNYRSIRDASVKLSPFTLLIGANGTGKSNFLQLLKALSLNSASITRGGSNNILKIHYPEIEKQKHIAHSEAEQTVEVNNEKGKYVVTDGLSIEQESLHELRDIKIFNLEPKASGAKENLIPNPRIEEDGQGLVRVLDSLKAGDREDLFNQIESIFKDHIPEIKKLSFVPGSLGKRLQVRERHMPSPIAVSELSEGTQLALQIITLLHQERKPSLICIEDIDKGLHPRLFQKIVQLCFDLTAEDDSIQIIATTHNPYLVDEFKGHESAVVIVEKANGETTFTTLEDKLQNLDPGEEPLGSLWYSGFVGGVPKGV